MAKIKRKSNNVYCFRCKQIVVSESEICPICNEKGKIVGTSTKLGTSNGRYQMHT